MHAQLLQLCPTLCNPMDHSLPGSPVCGILQARILEWVALPCSRGSSPPRQWTCISYVSCIGRQFLYHWATWEALISFTKCKYNVGNIFWRWKLISKTIFKPEISLNVVHCKGVSYWFEFSSEWLGKQGDQKRKSTKENAAGELIHIILV